MPTVSVLMDCWTEIRGEDGYFENGESVTWIRAMDRATFSGKRWW